MTKRKYDFSEDIKLKTLLWSARHCCLCGRQCGLDIEVAHIVKKSSDLDNAIPVCYNCHAQIGRYDRQHPRGNKYRELELKVRREQVYEEHTHHLVPPIGFEITQQIQDSNAVRPFPDVGFTISHRGIVHPVNVKVKLDIYLGDQSKNCIESKYYNGERIWNLNPQRIFFGHFFLPEEYVLSKERLTIQVSLMVIDIYQRNHNLLPVCYSYNREKNSWFLEPTTINQLAE